MKKTTNIEKIEKVEKMQKHIQTLEKGLEKAVLPIAKFYFEERKKIRGNFNYFLDTRWNTWEITYSPRAVKMTISDREEGTWVDEFCFPISYLDMSEEYWKEEILGFLKKEQEKQAEEMKKARIKAEEIREKKDKEEYLRLKEKFERIT